MTPEEMQKANQVQADARAAMLEFLAAHAKKDAHAMGRAQIKLAFALGGSMSAATGICLAVQEFDESGV